jgi:hypothetical protein
MTKTDALELALQALEDETSERYCPAITAIKKVLAGPDWNELTRGEIQSWDVPENLSQVEFAWFVESKVREKNE